MATYLYRTESGKCDGLKNHSELTIEGCNGRFQLSKPMTESSLPERCKYCQAELIRDITREGAPSIKFVGKGFYINESKD